MAPRGVVRLAVSLIFTNEDEFLNSDDGGMHTLYDGTCGTCGFISDALDVLDEWENRVNVEAPAAIIPYGQEKGKRHMGRGQDEPTTAQHRQRRPGQIRLHARPVRTHHARRHPF